MGCKLDRVSLKEYEWSIKPDKNYNRYNAINDKKWWEDEKGNRYKDYQEYLQEERDRKLKELGI